MDDEENPDGVLPPTVRIHAPQPGAAESAAVPAPAAPPPPLRLPAAPAPSPPPPPRAGIPGASEGARPAARDLTATDAFQVAGAPAAARSATQAEGGPGGPATPFSSSTLAELYFQQGLVERAADVYRQLLEQEPDNQKARQRLAELERSAPMAAERMARRRALERTIAGLEALLAAVRRR